MYCIQLFPHTRTRAARPQSGGLAFTLCRRYINADFCFVNGCRYRYRTEKRRIGHSSAASFSTARCEVYRVRVLFLFFEYFANRPCRRGGTARVAALGRSALAADRLFRKSLICGAASGEAVFCRTGATDEERADKGRKRGRRRCKRQKAV